MATVQATSRPVRLRPGGLAALGWLGIALLLAAPCSGGSRRATVPLNSSLPDTLTAADAERFGLYADVSGLSRFWFVPAPWGGYTVVLETIADGRVRVRERNVPRARWRQLQARVERVLEGAHPASEPLSQAPAWTDSALHREPRLRSPAGNPAPEAGGHEAGTDTTTAPRTPHRIRVWPEVPLPPARAATRPDRAAKSLYPGFADRWLTLLEAGYRHPISSFDAFFTGMAQFGLAFARTFGERFIPYGSFTIGFGDIKRDFEDIAGEGRSNVYSFALGTILRQPVGRKTFAYAGVEGGFYARLLQWGGLFQDPFTGRTTDGYVLEQQDFGWSVRLGIALQRPNTEKVRVWDLGIAYQTSPAERWAYHSDGKSFLGDGRDAWLVISLRFWDTL
jgi:hypothetical protein